LSWKLGTSGVLVKAGLGMFLPTGTIQGATGLNVPFLGVALPKWAATASPTSATIWTFQPELIISYLGVA